jgi:hypothetical protein
MPMARPKTSSFMLPRGSTKPAAPVDELDVAAAPEEVVPDAGVPEPVAVAPAGDTDEPEAVAVAEAEAVSVDDDPVASVVALITRNQFAAMGWPSPALSAKPDILNGYLAFTSAGGLKFAYACGTVNPFGCA